METIAAVFLGSGIGGVLRHLLNTQVARVMGSDFPWGILMVNLIGCTIMGFVAGWLAFRGDLPLYQRLFLTTGILGGFTTFSAFSLDTVLLVERGQYAGAALYVLASVVGSIGGLMLAITVMRGAVAS